MAGTLAMATTMGSPATKARQWITQVLFTSVLVTTTPFTDPNHENSRKYVIWSLHGQPFTSKSLEWSEKVTKYEIFHAK